MFKFIELFYRQSSKIIPIQILYAIITGCFVGLSYQNGQYAFIAVGFFLVLIGQQFSTNRYYNKFRILYNTLPIVKRDSFLGFMIISLLQSLIVMMVAIILTLVIKESKPIRPDIILHMLFFISLGLSAYGVILIQPKISILFSLLLFLSAFTLKQTTTMDVIITKSESKIIFIILTMTSLLFLFLLYKKKEIK